MTEHRPRAFGVYVHVPFCATRCGYCDFNTYTPAELGGANPDGWLEAMKVELELAARQLSARGTVPEASTVFVGGGNTFRLLHDVRRLGILDALRGNDACRYTGSSAGTNLAQPSVKTTNDMPIVDPGGLDALARVPFHVNPHYLDPDPTSTHQGETREERIREFHEMNPAPVVGLREGAWLHRTGDTLALGGNTARLFRRGEEPAELAAGTDLSWLVCDPPH